MLKARHCYSNENAFHNALFREKATIHSFALNPGHRVQVKFLIANEETAVTGRESIFYILDDKYRSRAFTLRDAENLLNFIAVVRDRRVSTYQEAGMVYDTSVGGNYTRRYIRSNHQQGYESIISNDNIAPVDIKNDPEYADKHWEQSLNRFEDIIKEFINVCSGKVPVISSWFVQGRFLMFPLNNRFNGVFKTHCLRLNWTREKKLNHLAFQSGANTVLFYGLNKDNTSSLTEVCEGFIDGMYRMVDAYKAHNDDMDMFIGSTPVILSEDRKHFMEYVGARGVGGESFDGAFRSIIISINSDASPAWSKVHFHYNHEFLCDLVDGIRVCTSMVIE